MIASFNRIKSLTPEVPMVQEMMELSSLLEVQGEHVRLVGEDAKKWVLPDAKRSSFPPTVYTATTTTTTTTNTSAIDSNSMSGELAATPTSEAVPVLDSSAASTAESEYMELPDELKLGEFTEQSKFPYLHDPNGVKDALMKKTSTSTSTNTQSQAPSSVVSVVGENGDESSSRLEASTPGTSVVGEVGEDDKAEK